MRRKKGIRVIVAVAAAIALVAGSVWAYRHDRAMRAALMELEKPRAFDPRGQATLTLAGKICLTLCGKIRITP